MSSNLRQPLLGTHWRTLIALQWPAAKQSRAQLAKLVPARREAAGMRATRVCGPRRNRVSVRRRRSLKPPKSQRCVSSFVPLPLRCWSLMLQAGSKIRKASRAGSPMAVARPAASSSCNSSCQEYTTTPATTVESREVMDRHYAQAQPHNSIYKLTQFPPTEPSHQQQHLLSLASLSSLLFILWAGSLATLLTN